MDEFSIELKKSDLTVFAHGLVLQNDTSGTSLLESQKIFLLELDEDSISLQLPRATCSQNHNLTLFIFDLPMVCTIKKIPSNQIIPEAKLTVSGKIVHYSEGEDELELYGYEKPCYVTVKLSNYDPLEWKDFLGEYLQVQEKFCSYKEKSAGGE